MAGKKGAKTKAAKAAEAANDIDIPADPTDISRHFTPPTRAKLGRAIGLRFRDFESRLQRDKDFIAENPEPTSALFRARFHERDLRDDTEWLSGDDIDDPEQAEQIKTIKQFYKAVGTHTHNHEEWNKQMENLAPPPNETEAERVTREALQVARDRALKSVETAVDEELKELESEYIGEPSTINLRSLSLDPSLSKLPTPVNDATDIRTPQPLSSKRPHPSTGRKGPMEHLKATPKTTKKRESKALRHAATGGTAKKFNLNTKAGRKTSKKGVKKTPATKKKHRYKPGSTYLHLYFCLYFWL
jgi:hypothetical protein